jgi:hypothetical protein
MPNDLKQFLPDKTHVFPGSPQSRTGSDQGTAAGRLVATYEKRAIRINQTSGEKQGNLSQ